MRSGPSTSGRSTSTPSPVRAGGLGGQWQLRRRQPAGRAHPGRGPCDVWVIATKAADVDGPRPVAPLLRPDDVVMAFQNGLGAGERVARRIPEEQIVIGIAEGFGSSVPEAGARAPRGDAAHPHRRDERRPDRARAGDRAGLARGRFQRRGLRRRPSHDLGEVPVQRDAQRPCAVFDVTVGELMADPVTWGVALGCTAEAHRLGLAKGVEFPFDDPLRYVTDFAATIPNSSRPCGWTMCRPALGGRCHQRAGGHAEPRTRTRGSLQRDPVRRSSSERSALRLISAAAVPRLDNGDSLGRPLCSGGRGVRRCDSGGHGRTQRRLCRAADPVRR